MIYAPPILAAKAAAIILASTSMTCKLTDAPAVSIKVLTDEIQYDYSQSAQTLTGVKTDTVSPYGKADTVTGGLRADRPEIETKMGWGIVTLPSLNQSCMSYKNVDITIHLKPHIYVAKEFNYSPCSEAVLGHEKHHVQVDRAVMNKYATLIGQAVQSAINKAGILGPYRVSDEKTVEQQASKYILDTMKIQEAALDAEMHARQSEVDSRVEYDRVGTFCTKVNLPRGGR